VFEGVKAAAVHNPLTLTELITLRAKLPKALIWAGGTDIISRLRPYPAGDGIDIISLARVQEMKRISRSERFIEIGAFASIEETMIVGHTILPPVLYEACRSSASLIIRSQATFGGAVAAPGLTLNIPAALSVLEGQIELRSPLERKNSSRWVPVQRFFGRAIEQRQLEPAVITRVRIMLEESDFSFFHVVGEPYLVPDEAVILSLVARFNYPAVSECRFSLTFPQCGVFRNREMESSLAGMDLPLTQRDIRRIIRTLMQDSVVKTEKTTPIQKERAARVFELALHQMNRQSLNR
jgi:CO/xanthine dehydrogenase FAD-binding subunit